MEKVPPAVEWVDCVACDGTGGNFGDSDIECFVCDGRGQVINDSQLPVLSIDILNGKPAPGSGFIFSIGPAVDLAKADEALRKFSREPWDLPPAHPTPTPGDPEQ